MNSFLAGNHCPIPNPPKLETAVYFLTVFTNLEAEFNRIDLANTGLFNLEHPETAQQLNLAGAIRAIRYKSKLAKELLRWVDDNRYRLEFHTQSGFPGSEEPPGQTAPQLRRYPPGDIPTDLSAFHRTY